MSKKTTIEDFQKKIEISQPERNFAFIGFDGTNAPLKVICNDCGFEKDYTKASTFMKITSHFQCNCPNYSKRGGGFVHRHTLESYQKEMIDKKFGDNKIRLISFTKVQEPCEIECCRCGKKRTFISANKIISNIYPCFDCDANILRIDEMQKELNAKFGENEFLIITAESSKSEITLRHKCGFIFSRYCYFDFLKSKKCPKCHKGISKGELAIIEYLASKNIPFKKEYSVLGGSFRFDFAILLDEIPFLLIEFDGEGHYLDTSSFWKRTLSQVQEVDKFKNLWAEQNNLPLLRIPYTEFNNIEILIKEFLTFNDYPVGE